MSKDARSPGNRSAWRSRTWWLALLLAAAALAGYWAWRAGLLWSRLSEPAFTWWWVQDAPITAACVLLMAYAGAKLRPPRPIDRDASLRPLPGGGYLRWSSTLLFTAAVIAAVTTARTLSPQGHGAVLKSVSLTAITAIVDGGALYYFLYSVYRLVIVRLARKPGPVEIPLVADATVAGGAPVQECTLTLRRYLAASNLYPQSLIPGNAPPQDFVSLVQAATANMGRSTLSRVASLLAIVPTYAYQVHASLLRRDDLDQPYGVSVQVLLRPRWLSRPAIFWARSWDAAIEHAAHAVAQEILPWTKRATEPTWGDWVDRQLPDDLFDRYQQAKALLDERRYDEALGAYHDALSVDPGNLQLRLEIAAVYQKLALWLDALEIYRNVLELAAPRLQQWVFPVDRRRRARQRSARQAELLAQYRYTVSLGWGELLAYQWMKRPDTDPDDDTALGRDRERALIRERLRGRLIEDVAALLPKPTSSGVSEGHNIDRNAQLVSVLKPKHDEEPGSEVTIRLLFQVLAFEQARKIRHRGFDEKHWRLYAGLTAVSWELFEIWTALRLAWAVAAASDPDAPYLEKEDDEHANARELLLTMARKQLEATSPTWADLVGKIGQRIEKALAAGHPEWLDHYNAACASAVPLLDGAPSTAASIKDDVTATAKSHLEEAMRDAGSARLRRLAPWIGSEDPDLRGFRGSVEFRGLVARYFPGLPPQVTHPGNAHIYELALHTAQTVRRSARVFAEHWQRQSGEPMPAAPALLRMWAQESSAWQSVAEMGRNNQHWQTRLELMRQMTLWSVEYGIDPPDWRHPDYSQVVSRKATAAEVRKWVDEFDDRFKRLHALLARSGGLGAVVQECEDHVRNLDADGVRLRQSEWRRLCVQQCRLWRIVQEWFSDDPHFRDRPPNDCEMSLLRETERIRRRLEIRKATLRLRVAWPD